MKKAFTFIEVLTCAAVTGLVSGLVFTATAGTRESGRQRLCAQNMKEIYQGLLMYAADNPGPEQYPGLGQIKLLPQADRIVKYVKSNQVFFCPDTPRLKQTALKYWSTYELNFINVSSKDTKLQSYKNTFKTELETLGNKLPLVICNMHDETYYGPREQDIDSDLAQPFQIQLQLDGNIAAHRFVAKRHRSFTANLGGS